MKMANMNRRDIRQMFPNQMVCIDDTGVDLLDLATGQRIASVVYAAHSGAIVWLYTSKKVIGKPDHKTVAHVKTYEYEADHHKAAQAERRQAGRKELGDRTIKNEWNKIQEQDFKEALEILRVFIHLMAGNTGGGATREQFKKLTAYGRVLNNRLQREIDAEMDPMHQHKVQRAAETVDDRIARQDAREEAPNVPPVAQLANALEFGQSNQRLIEKLLEALDKNATVSDTRHQTLHQHLVKNGVTCRRILVGNVGMSRVNANRCLRRMMNCGLVQEKMMGHTKQYIALTPEGIDVQRVSAAYAVLVMQYTYEETADKYKAAYGTMP